MRRVRLSSRSGVSLLLLAISVVALLGMAVLAIDLAMLQKARAEAQRAADAAALAGASAFLLSQTRAQESALAVRRAKTLADTNTMMGTRIDSASEVTVQVIADSEKVRVTVRRARVPTWFARIFGRDAFPIGARAAAIADYAGGTRCVKPIAIPDLWDDADQDLNGDHAPDNETWTWDPAAGDYYQVPNLNTGTGTGYGSSLRDGAGTVRDWGRRIILKDNGNMGENTCLDNQGNKCLIPGWWGLWALDPQELFNVTQAAIENCRDKTVYVNQTYPTVTGQKNALKDELKRVFNSDPNVTWSPGTVDRVTGNTGTYVGSTATDWRLSSRAWIMGLFDPASAPTKANTTFRFNNFFLFFFEGCMNNSGNVTNNCGPQTDLVGRFVGISQGTGPGQSTLSRLLRLVE